MFRWGYRTSLSKNSLMLSEHLYTNLCKQSTHLSSRHLLNAVTRGIQQRRLGNLLAHDMALEEVRQPDLGLVLEVHARRHAEDLVQLFEGELLSFAHEAEDHAPCDEVETSVETD
jgi:hypothetical protein